VAISNHRLVDGKVTFRWRDSARHNEQKLLTLPLDEFLRHFLLHLLPDRWWHAERYAKNERFWLSRANTLLRSMYAFQVIAGDGRPVKI